MGRNSYAHSEYERHYSKKGHVIIGVDEVGRGALAGPIAVGALVLTPTLIDDDCNYLERLKVRDSKMLSPLQREKFSQSIQQKNFVSAVGFVDVQVIDAHGIVYAFQQAARTAIAQVQKILATTLPIFLLTDAFKIYDVKGVGQSSQLNIIKGDAQCVSIAAASIIAKVARDKYMTELAQKYAVYKWDLNKGYGTRDHIDAIKKNGLTPHHRALYVRKIYTSSMYDISKL